MESDAFDKYRQNMLDKLELINTGAKDKEVFREVFDGMFSYLIKSRTETEAFIRRSLETKEELNIYSGIMTAKELMEQPDNVFPICSEDFQDKTIDLTELRNSLNLNRPYKAFSIYLDVNYKTLTEFNAVNRVFECKIISEEWTYTGKCVVKPKRDYYLKFEELYKVFVKNGKQFVCPFTPYINRFYDVYIVEADFYDIESIKSVVVDWQEYEAYVKYDYYPVWNITEKRVISEVKPIPCAEVSQYCHTINGRRLLENCSYLVDEKKVIVYDTSYLDDFLIYSSIEKKKRWNLLEFHKKHDVQTEFPFWNIPVILSEYKISTYADIYRFVNRLAYQKYIVLKNVEIKAAGVCPKGTYDMHEYIQDRLEQTSDKKQLWLYFENKMGNSNYAVDMLSFIVSLLQQECNQYECIGRFE